MKSAKILVVAVASAVMGTLAGCASAPGFAGTEMADTPVPTAGASRYTQPRTQAPTAAQLEMEREIRASGVDQLAKSFMNEEMIGLMFGMFRSMAEGKETQVSPALEKRMEQMSDELPKKMSPIMSKMLTIAEQEVRRSLKEQSAKDVAK
jgi:hypothetical protein